MNDSRIGLRLFSPTTVSRLLGKLEPANENGCVTPPENAAEFYMGQAQKLAADRVAELRALETHGWDGWREMEITKRVVEGDHQVSFYLKPTDGGPLPSYKPGQFLTFKVPVDGKDEIRCYSLSDAPNGDHYRITIKRALAPAGVPEAKNGKVSSFFQDELPTGSKVMARAPAGSFVLDTAKTTPVVLIAGGVGVTPFLAMVNALAEQGSQREVHFFYAARNTSELIMKHQLREI